MSLKNTLQNNFVYNMKFYQIRSNAISFRNFCLGYNVCLFKSTKFRLVKTDLSLTLQSMNKPNY